MKEFQEYRRQQTNFFQNISAEHQKLKEEYASPNGGERSLKLKIDTTDAEVDMGGSLIESQQVHFLLIYTCNFHVLSNLLLIYIYKLHWNRSS